MKTLTGKTILTIGIGVTLILALASYVSYRLIFQEVEQRVLVQLSQYVMQRGKVEGEIFALTRDLHHIIKRDLLERWDQEIPLEETRRRFDELYMRYPDGAVRSRPEYADGVKYTTTWIRQGVELTPVLQRRVLLFHDLSQQYAPGAQVRSLSLFFFTSTDQVNVGFAPKLPTWVLDTAADFDQTQVEWGYVADVAHNPGRQTMWTGVNFSPLVKAFFVSAATPVDRDGQHIATIASDIHLDDLLATILRVDIAGAAHAVFRADGRLIAHSSKMPEIMASQGRYRIQDSSEPQLIALLQAVREKPDLPGSGYDGRTEHYFAVHRLEGPGWYFASVMPASLVRAAAFHDAQWVLWTGLLSLSLVLVTLSAILHRQIALPLQQLLTATRQVRTQASLIPLDTQRQDEIGQLASAFVETAQAIADESRQRTLALERETAERQRVDAALRDSEVRYQLVAEQTGHILYEYDLASGSMRWTGPITAVTGYPARMWQCHDIAQWEQCIHPEDREAVLHELVRAQTERRKYLLEYRFRCADSTYVYVENEGTVLTDAAGHAQRLLGTMRNIAERKQAEAALRQAMQAAESANSAKSQFLTTVSHELRTPLNGILGYTQILRREGSLTTAQQHGLQVIHESAEHLLGLINDILDLARIESHKLEVNRHAFQVREFLAGIAGMCLLRAQQRQLTFRQDIDPRLPATVLGDAQKLRQVLLNLLGNAIKFTDTGEVLFAVRGEGERIHFTVQDTGGGIRPEELAQIFQPFQQVGDTRQHIEGTGLGLAISRGLVEIMEGVLQVDSVWGSGSRFWFSLPLPAVAVPASIDQTPRLKIIGYHGARRRVLIADDIPQNRAVLVAMLAPLDFVIAEAADGQQALETALTFHPDVILMDMRMPVLDGLEATRRIHAVEGLRQVMVLAVSASAFVRNREEYLAAGATDFLPKPVRYAELLELLHRHLGLEWIYADGVKEPASRDQTTLPSMLVAPEQAVLDVLLELARRGDVKNLLARADHLECESQYATFVAELRTLAKGFQMQKIVQFLTTMQQRV